MHTYSEQFNTLLMFLSVSWSAAHGMDSKHCYYSLVSEIEGMQIACIAYGASEHEIDILNFLFSIAYQLKNQATK